MKKFYKTTYVIEVLTEDEPMPSCIPDLASIEYDYTYGHASGSFTCTEQKELTAKEAAEALLEQGSDPEFFGLDEEGNKLQEESDDEKDSLF